jgi:small subunit ribosomal protein S16
MLSIRLSRTGRKKAPTYRVVVMPQHRDPWGNFVEILGHYNPRANPRELVLKTDRVKHWLDNGAQPSDTVWNLFVDEKLVEGKKRGVTTISKKRSGKLEAKVVEAKEKAETAKAKAEEAKVKAAEEAAAAKEAAAAEKVAAEEAAKAEAEAPVEEAAPVEETPAEEEKEETPAEEAPATEAEAPAEEAAPVEETPAEEEKEEEAPTEEKTAE